MDVLHHEVFVAKCSLIIRLLNDETLLQIKICCSFLSSHLLSVYYWSEVKLIADSMIM